MNMVLWQHVGDLRPLSSSNEEKWPARVETQTWDPELVCPLATRPPPLQILKLPNKITIKLLLSLLLLLLL